ncbi:FHA domain-containing protein [Picosynechococcus sp. PCC 73109]|uniref:FHA domain-containing protein n=1 Tax=Picosynechococcus sp. PCC 73109 TaxID=374982 RepID=UPI0007458066|nr:FHA domain-containing protein [Picosynechococcus sp. PCC 73109]AMA08690.1 phosphopeptide-binding protein [Picosynechococcus sp. PCC 73109]
MISCPNCNHQNPDGAVQCEACYTPLPQASACPQCGASVQSNAAFCGQCGFNLQQAAPMAVTEELPKTVVPNAPSASAPPTAPPEPTLDFPEIPEADFPDFPDFFEEEEAAAPAVAESPELPDPFTLDFEEPSPAPEVPPTPAPAPAPTTVQGSMQATQIQVQTASLLHVQTQVALEIPEHLDVIHIGKPNETVPPDIDVSGFPSSEVVSRVHADLRQEAGLYYIEDTGSSNGTYINHVPLPVGNRHRLRAGDRIGLGKGDKVTFIFQIS